MSLINCEINIFLTWSEKSIIVTGDYADREPKFAITETKLYVPVVTLLTVDNEKLLQQSKTGCKITINWNKYQSEPTTKTRNQYLNHLIDPSFQGVNRLFVLSYENDAYQNKLQATTSKRKQCCDWWKKNFFEQPIKNDLIIYSNIRKITTGQDDDYTTGCLQNYTFLKNCYKMIAIDLSKQQALDADPKAIQQLRFIANLNQAGNTTMFFIFDKKLWKYYNFILF